MKADKKTREKLGEIGKAIRTVRERSKTSQAKLAKAVGMARENIIRIEKGGSNLTIETLMRLADGLGVELQVRLVRKR